VGRPARLRHLAIAVVLGLLPAPLAAQGLGVLTRDSDEPLKIDADDGIEWNQAKKIYLARGNVRAASGEVIVFADQLTAHYRDAAHGGTEIWRLNADGNVRIASTSETAHGDHGVYDVDQGILVLTGRSLRLDATDARITARDSLEYWERRQVAVARGAAHAVQAPNQLWADVLSAYLRQDADGKTAIQRIEAFGQVRIETAQDVVLGDHGLYNLDSRTAILCDGVTIVRGNDRLTGEVAEVNLTSGRARLRPGQCSFTVK
jgi:lipopolysaccharide export system protein LptA